MERAESFMHRSSRRINGYPLDRHGAPDRMRPMNCLVTAGPTSEPIDRVRRLTNFSTGRLGTELAAHLSRTGHGVTLFRSETATAAAPQDSMRVESFSTTEDLGRRLEALGATPPDAVFHVAAVSDFTPGGLFHRGQDGGLERVEGGKVSSRETGLLMELKPTRKLIAHFREWYPASVLVGWKYEVDGGRDGACAAAMRQWRDCGLTATVVNGPAFGDGYGVIAGDGDMMECGTREVLFEVLGRLLTERNV